MPYAQVNEIEIFYRVFYRGQEMPEVDPRLKTMIVLHGGPGFVDHQIELDHWQGFSDLVQVVFYDCRGCGRSGGSPENWSLRQCAEDLFGLIEALGLKRPIVAGVSYGGYVIMQYIELHSDHLGAAILCTTEAKKSISERQKMFLKMGGPKAEKAALDFDLDPTNTEKSDFFFETCVPYFSKKLLVLTPPFKADPGIWTKAAQAWSELDFRQSLQKHVRCPILLLAGEDDPNHPVACAYETAQYIPAEFLQFEAIPEAGAPVYIDQPEVFERHVRAFLKKVANAK